MKPQTNKENIFCSFKQHADVNGICLDDKCSVL